MKTYIDAIKETIEDLANFRYENAFAPQPFNTAEIFEILIDRYKAKLDESVLLDAQITLPKLSETSIEQLHNDIVAEILANCRIENNCITYNPNTDKSSEKLGEFEYNLHREHEDELKKVFEKYEARSS